MAEIVVLSHITLTQPARIAKTGRRLRRNRRLLEKSSGLMVLYLGRKVFTEINKCRSFPANWKRKLTNRVEKGFSSYRRCGGRLLRSIFSRTSIRTFLVVLGVVSLSLCAVTCRISATERQHMTSELPVTVAQASGNAATEPSTTERVTVLQISESDKDGRTTVEISLSGRASCRSFTLSDPERLVVDVEGAVLLSRPDPIPVEDGIIEKIRVGQFNPSVVRVVFDLSRATSYSVVQTEDKPDVICVSFPKRMTGVEFFDRDGRAEAVILGNGSMDYETSSLTDPPRIVVDLPGTVMVSDAIEVPVSHPQVTRVRASQHEPDEVRVVLDLVKPTTYSVSTSSERPGEVVVDLGCRILGAEFAGDDKSTTVDVVSSGNPEVKFMVLAAPQRIVMDFENSTLDTTRREIPVGDGVVKRIRLAQHSPMTVRVVLDLEYYVGHSAQAEPGGKGARVEVFKSSMADAVIVIDPGHGGTDPGAIGPTGLHEKAVVLDISKRVATQLQAMGAEVVLTRSDDVSVTLPERVKAASNGRVDAFISIHANASRTGEPTGTETLYSGTVSMSRVLAESVQTALVSQIGQVDRGARERNDLMVIREAKCPACLVEVVFMSNLKEELLLLDPAFRQKAAQGITNGIAAYFQWRKDRQSQAPVGPEEKPLVTESDEAATFSGSGLQEDEQEDSGSRTEQLEGQEEQS